MTLKKRANKKGIVNNLLHMYNLSLYFPNQKLCTSEKLCAGNNTDGLEWEWVLKSKQRKNFKCQKIFSMNRSWCIHNLTFSSWWRRQPTNERTNESCNRNGYALNLCRSNQRMHRISRFNCLFSNVFNFWLTITIIRKQPPTFARFYTAQPKVEKELTTSKLKTPRNERHSNV